MTDNKRAADDAEREALLKWKIVDGDCREGSDGLITFHVEAFKEGLEIARAALSSRADGGKDSSDARDAERWRMNIRLMRRKHGQREINEVLAVVDAAIAKEKK